MSSKLCQANYVKQINVMYVCDERLLTITVNTQRKVFRRRRFFWHEPIL